MRVSSVSEHQNKTRSKIVVPGVLDEEIILIFKVPIDRPTMGKRYYCDYCDKTFADSPVNRKKHVNGIQHQRNRKLHYDSFKDPAQLLAEESQKAPCKRFFQSGNCDFGINCRYSHTNPQILLENQVISAAKQSQAQTGPKPEIHVWLARWEKKKKCRQDRKKVKTTQDEHQKDLETFTLPSNLPPLADLPPSLVPPPPWWPS